MFRIKKLDIFITKQFGLLFIGTFFICQFVLMMQFLWRYVDELIGKGINGNIDGVNFIPGQSDAFDGAPMPSPIDGPMPF